MATTTRSKMGRPPLPPEERAGRHIHVRASEQTIAELEALAELLGCQKADALRHAITLALAAAQKGGR